MAVLGNVAQRSGPPRLAQARAYHRPGPPYGHRALKKMRQRGPALQRGRANSSLVLSMGDMRE
jgi:hypothetical protein